MLFNKKIKFKNNLIVIFISKTRTINFCLFVCSFIFCAKVQSQACYNNITDANGIIISQSQINILESASCRLIDSLPSMYRDSFKVYDFGFYAHNERMLGGLPQIFLLAIDTVKSRSKYYVLLGKQFDSTGVCTKFWVDLSLPRGGQLSCLNDTKVQQIKNYVDYWVNNSFSNLFFNPYSFHISQSLAIDSLASTISKIPTCCLNNYSNCMNCLSRNDIKGILDRKGFRKLPIEIQPPVISKVSLPRTPYCPFPQFYPLGSFRRFPERR